MVKSATKTVIKLKVDIRPRSATPAMKATWRKLFSRLIAEVKKELQSVSEVKADGQ